MIPQLTPEALLFELGRLVAEMPDLANGPITPEINRWLGRAVVLVELMGDAVNTVRLKVISQNLPGTLRESNAQTIAAIIHASLAKAELNAPAASQGSFIVAGNTFDAFAAVGKVLSEATNDVLIVDPYADAKVVMDYAVLAPETVSVRVLGRSKETSRASLKPAAALWEQQFGKDRPLTVRLAPAKSLHDRWIIVDGKIAWALGQSFNKLAERAHTTLLKALPEPAALIAAYEEMWASATPLS